MSRVHFIVVYDEQSARPQIHSHFFTRKQTFNLFAESPKFHRCGVIVVATRLNRFLAIGYPSVCGQCD